MHCVKARYRFYSSAEQETLLSAFPWMHRKGKKSAPKLDRNLKALRCLNCIASAAIASCVVTSRDNGQRMEIRVVENFIIVRFAFVANER